jgi:endonuclease/exonuclease/phosphatase (EEP) superfamily protein YafD
MADQKRRAGKQVHRLILAGFWMNLLLIVASYGGALHGIGDSLAVFRQFWAIALGVCSLLLLRGYLRTAFFGAISVTLVLAPATVGYLRSETQVGNAFSLYQKNLLFSNPTFDDVAADISQLSPDFVTLEEVSDFNRDVYDNLAETYTSHLYCPFTLGSLAALSKWPVVEDTMTCGGSKGFAAMQLETSAGLVWLIAVHLHWPYPFGQPLQVAQVLEEISKLDGKIVIAGDFNMVPWSYTLRAFQRVSGSERAGPIVQTLHLDDIPVKLPIDHILVPGGVGELTLRPRFGSDHVGLLLRFDL